MTKLTLKGLATNTTGIKHTMLLLVCICLFSAYSLAQNVGIGTTTPAYKLDVAGQSRATSAGGGSSAAFIANGNSSAVAFNMNSSNVDQSWWDIFAYGNSLQGRAVNDANTISAQWLYVTRGTGASITNVDFPSGNVGIGTYSPAYKLDVAGQSRSTSAGGGSSAAVIASGNSSAVAFKMNSSNVDESWWDIFAYGNSLQGRAVNDANTGSTQWLYVTRGTGAAISNVNFPNGNVGIGTYSPSSLLDVNGKTTTDSFAMTSGANSGYLLQSDSNGNASWVSPSTIASQNIYNVDGTLSGNRTVTMGADNLTLSSTTGNLIFNTGSGGVGIGTSSPAYKLDVAGQSRMSASGGGSAAAIIANGSGPGMAWDVNGQATDQKWWDMIGSGTSLRGRAVNDSNTASKEWLRVNRGSGYTINNVNFPNGSVGIGTTSPRGTLDITGSNYVTGILESSSIDGTWLSTHNSSSGGQWFNMINTGSDNGQGAGKLIFTQGFTQYSTGYNFITMDWNSNNTGIGTNHPDRPLAIKGNGYNDLLSFMDNNDTTRWHMGLKNTNGTSSGKFDLNFAETLVADWRLYLQAGGNVGIGTNNPSYKLDVAGQARMNASGGGSASAVIVNGSSSSVAWDVNGQATDQKWWDMYGSGTTLTGRALNDANSAATSWLQVNRGAGYTISSVTFPHGNVGIGTSAPLTLLANTSTNIIGSDGIGINANSITWAYNSQGYALALYNSSTGYGSNGLAVKTTDSTALTRILDLSRGSSQIGTGTAIMVVEGNGNVGIGTSNPSSLLDVNGKTTTANFEMTAGANSGYLLQSDASGNGTWVNPSTIASQNIYNTNGTLSGNRTISMGADNLTLSSSSGDFIFSSTSGQVGIGTATPAYKLDVAGQGRMTASGGGSSSALIANGSNAAMAWDVNGQSLDQQWWDMLGSGTTLTGRAVNDANSASTNWLQVNRGSGYTISSVTFPNGLVGVGTTGPAAPLDIAAVATVNTSTVSHYNSFTGITYSGFTYLQTNGNTSNTGYISTDGNYPISVRATGGMLAPFFIAPSDARIKNIIGASCNAEDLETLNKIKVTDYSMRDQKVAGNSIFKKVIAQQLKEVYPQAVKKSPLEQFIPNIYQKAESYTIQGNQLTVNMAIALTDTNIKTGSMCKFYVYDKDGKEKEMKGSIIAFGGKQMQLILADSINSDELSELLFVYGVEINDLLTVDYEAISMLNVSATQELARKLRASEQTITALTDQNQKLEKALNAKANDSDMQQMKAEIESLKAMMLSSAGK